MDKNKYLGGQRQRRQFRVRKRIRGSTERPRLTRVPQPSQSGLPDHRRRQRQDARRRRHARTRTCGPTSTYGGNKAAAQAIGKLLAEKAIAAGIKEVAFDRGHYKYHGRVAALADAAREAGLSF